MNPTIRFALAASSVLFIATASIACGGFSEDEALLRCEQEEEARGTQGCFTDAASDNCRAAYEECGQDVEVIEECPVQYVCPE